MTIIRSLFIIGLCTVSSIAQAQSIKTITTTTSHGTATTEVTRNGNTVTAVTRFQPSKPGYQPTGAGGYKPMGGGGGYKPMGQ
jgi:hypothetical protein